MPEPVNLLVVSLYSSVEFGGAERYISEVSSRLKKSEFNLYHVSSESAFPRVSKGFRLASSQFSFAWCRELKSIIKKLDIHVVYVHVSVPALAEVAVFSAHSLNIPVCLMYHSDITGSSIYKKIFGYFYGVIFLDRILNHVDHVITTSKRFFNSSKSLAKLDPSAHNISFAPPGVSSELLSQHTGLTLPPKPFILFVGKPDAQNKGFPYLYEAFKRLSVTHDIELCVVGQTQKHNECNIRYLGSISSRSYLGKLYSNALVTVLPSISSESFGMVLAESLVCGTPIIGSNIGGISDVIENGKNGLVIKPGSVDALANALKNVISENDTFRSYIATQNYAEKYSWDATAKHIADTLKHLAQSRP